ncbi:MAG: NAD-dependent epimerase/dehydratase family protein [Nitrosopumilaceae archaeon]
MTTFLSQVKPLSNEPNLEMLKALVTGATGFIGSRLVTKLVDRGVSVTCLVRSGSIQNPEVKMVNGDLTYPDFILPDEKYDIVYHLAAVWPGEKDKKKARTVNYDGSVNLFTLIKEKAKFLVYVSGLGVFGDPKNTVDENSTLQPHTEYSKTRLEAQWFLGSSCKEKNIDFSVAYLGDVYGNGGWFKSIMIDRLQNGSFRLPAGGEYYRSFIHVDDVISALVAIAEKNAINQSFVVTDSNPVLFKDFVNFVCDEMKVKHPGSVPALLAKAVMGGDFVKLLTTSIKTTNKKISTICEFAFPSYKEGIHSVIAEMKT